jgi:hypothetical protein
MRNQKPVLQVEVAGLGTVDPFQLRVVQEPPGSGKFCIEDPGQEGRRAALELAGLSLAGAGQALLVLSMRWMDRAGRALTPEPALAAGEIRMVLRRREARLLSALLRRHVDRLPEPPAWMPDLLASLEQIDEFLRWEDP